MQSIALLGVTTLALVQAMAAPPKEEGMKKKEKPGADAAASDKLDLHDYYVSLEIYGETIDPSVYEDLYDYDDLAPKIKVGTLPPPTKCLEGFLSTRARPTNTPAHPPLEASTAKPEKPGLLGSITEQDDAATDEISRYMSDGDSLPSADLPTCLLCVCLSTSVYCDDANLEQIPPLPLETTYLYARFNRIGRIRASDFVGLKKLKRIDLTSNYLSWVDEDSFQQLSALQELIVAENRLTALPALPSGIVRLDARLNRIQTSGLRPEAFRELKKLQFLQLSDNQLDYIPVPLPEGLRSLHLQNNNIQTLHEGTFCNSQDHHYIRRALEDIRLDGNPINLSLFPNAYVCLPRLPTGRFY